MYTASKNGEPNGIRNTCLQRISQHRTSQPQRQNRTDQPQRQTPKSIKVGKVLCDIIPGCHDVHIHAIRNYTLFRTRDRKLECHRHSLPSKPCLQSSKLQGRGIWQRSNMRSWTQPIRQSCRTPLRANIHHEYKVLDLQWAAEGATMCPQESKAGDICKTSHDEEHMRDNIR